MNQDLDAIFGSPHIPEARCEEFFGWPSQILREVSVLLSEKDESWLAGAAEQLEVFLRGDAPGFRYDEELLNKAHPARSLNAPFSILMEQPSRVVVFSALERTVDWETFSPKLQQWERFAVFALLHVRKCLVLLDARPPQAESAGEAAKRFSDAGGNALEASRALQIAHSLRLESIHRSTRAKHAAGALHANREALLDSAINIAKSKPFRTKKAAAEEVVNQLPKDDKGTPYDLATVLGWFRERGFYIVRKTKPLQDETQET